MTERYIPDGTEPKAKVVAEAHDTSRLVRRHEAIKHWEARARNVTDPHTQELTSFEHYLGRRVMLGFGDAEWAYDQLFERDRRPGEIGGAIAEPTSEL